MEKEKETRMETHVLEINLISAQGLKDPSRLHQMHTYAVAWVDPSSKLRTRIDRVGSDNPTWNDKFFFRVSMDFLTSETSGVSIEIYSVGCLRDQLIGTVRFLVSNFLPGGGTTAAAAAAAMKSPSFVALQIRRPSGRFHGVLNLGAMVVNCSDFAANMSGRAAIGYRDLMSESLIRRQRRQRRLRKTKSMATDAGSVNGHVSGENSFVDVTDYSDGPSSAASSPLSTISPLKSPLKDWNGIRDLAGKNHLRSSSDGGGMLCCFLMQKRMPVTDT